MKYELRIDRISIDVGYVEIEAESEDDALRKYWEPDFSKGEDIIFDDEIAWSHCDSEYTAHIVRR